MENLYYTKIVALLVLLGSIQVAVAQAPAWTVTASDYQYSMTVTAFLNVEGSILTAELDQVAAFVDDEIRGVASPIYVSGADRYLAYLTVYANKEGELLSFKLYDSASDRVVSVDTTIGFVIDEQYGNVFQAISLANPPLNNEAEIKNFYFTAVDSVSTQISDGQVDIVLEYNQDLTHLTPEFKISSGAEMYIDRALQESGSAIYDFSVPMTYAVLSEDEGVLKTYEIMVTNRQTSGSDFLCSNVITVNNDGNNDYWIVQDVFKYRNHKFKIFDGNGRMLFESVGYNNDWGGYNKGERINRGKYYFIIENTETHTIIKGDILVIY